MSLRIDLAEKKSVWLPGEVVLGTVVARPSPQIDVDRVWALCEGRVKSKIAIKRNNNTSTYRTWVTVFQQRVVLFQGPFTLAKDQEWPFTFQIPLDCRNATGATQLGKSERSRFNWDPMQPLPPTMTSSDDNLFGPSTECYVQYRIRAELVCSSSVRRNWEFESRLNVMPYREEQYRFWNPAFHPYPRKIVTSSMHLDPGIGDRELTMKEKLKSSFSSKSVPSVAYNITTSIPDSAISRRPIPVLLSLSLAAGGSIDELPPVDLKSFTLHIVTYTQQVTQSGSGFFNESSRIESWDNEILVGRWAGTALIGDNLDLLSLDPKMGSNWSATPSFNTFNVARWYSLKLKMKLECAKKQEDITVLTTRTPLKLLSPYTSPVMEGAIVMANALDQPPEEQIPSYGEAIKS